jgi:hypothetical protein
MLPCEWLCNSRQRLVNPRAPRGEASRIFRNTHDGDRTDKGDGALRVRVRSRWNTANPTAGFLAARRWSFDFRRAGSDGRSASAALS